MFSVVVLKNVAKIAIILNIQATIAKKSAKIQRKLSVSKQIVRHAVMRRRSILC